MTQKTEENKLHIEVVRQMLTLVTSGFGLVAALAWNTAIQEFVTNYVQEYLPGEQETISLFVYAIIITLLAVLVTLQLSKLLRRLEK